MTINLEGCLVGLGNPLLDISSPVDTALLEKYNLKSNDAIMAEDKHIPLFSDLISSYKVEYVAGGATQNAIRGAQWMLPPRSTVYMGCVGQVYRGFILFELSLRSYFLTSNNYYKER